MLPRRFSTVVLCTLMLFAADRTFAKPHACASDPDPAKILAACSRALDREKGPAARAGIFAARGLAHLRLGHFNEAAADSVDAIRADQANPEVLVLAAIVNAQAGQLDGAMTAYDHALKREPRNLAALIGRAQIFGQIRDYANGIADLNRALEVDPKNVAALAQRSIFWRRLGEYDLALRDVDAAVRLAPKDFSYLLNRAALNLGRKRPELAAIDATAALKLAQSDWAYVTRAQARLASGLNDAAFADLGEALSIAPRNGEALWLRAGIFRDRQETDKQIADLSALIAVNPKDGLAFEQRAMAFLRKKDEARARLDYADAIRLLPGEKRLRDAVATLDGAPGAPLATLEASPKPTDAAQLTEVPAGQKAALYVSRAVFFFGQDKYADALTQLDLAIAADSSNAEAWELRSFVHASLGDLTGKIADLDRLIVLRPSDAAKTLIERAKTNRRLKQLGAALADVEEAHRRGYPSSAAHLLRGGLLFDLGRLDEAERAYADCIRVDPYDAACANARAWALHKLGRNDEALVDVERSLNLKANDPYTLDTQGHILAALGRKREAVIVFRQALKLKPDLAESREGLVSLGSAP